MISTTGTSINEYLEWARREIEKKSYGNVSLNFTICNNQVVDVEKGSIDREHYPMRKQ